MFLFTAVRLAPSQFRHSKKNWEKETQEREKRDISFRLYLSDRLITDDEIDLGQVYTALS